METVLGEDAQVELTEEAAEAAGDVSPPDGLAGFVVTPESVGAMSSEHLEHQMRQLAGHLAAATASFLVMVGEYDERGAWSDWEALSCAHWLSWRCGVGMVAAREQVRVARALRSLPTVTAKFLAGEVSYSKVRAITRVAHGNNEADLVDMAQWGTAAQIERACAALRRSQEQQDEERALRDGEDVARSLRSFTWGHDDLTGDLIGRVRVPAEDAEALMSALDVVVAEATRALKGALDADEDEPTLAQRRADAMVELARYHLAHPPEGASCGVQPEITVRVDANALADVIAAHGTDPASGSAAGSVSEDGVEPATPEDRSAAVDADRRAVDSGAAGSAPADDTAASTGSCSDAACDGPGTVGDPGKVPAELQGLVDRLRAWPVLSGRGRRLSIAVLQRLSCDAGMRLVARLGDGTELDAAPHTRSPNRALRRWLLRRDDGCRFPGCGVRQGLHAHHIVHWEDGGPTVRENLLMLCAKHHRAVHEGGWGLTGTASEHTFTKPDRTVVPERAPALSGALGELVEAYRRHGIDIAADGAGSRWMGDHIDWACFFAAFGDGPRAVRPGSTPLPTAAGPPPSASAEASAA